MNCIVFAEQSDNRLIVAYSAEDGSDIDVAVVSVIIYDERHEEIAGQAWPSFMDLISSLPIGSVIPDVERPNSTYTILFDSTLDIKSGKFYKARIVMTSALGNRTHEQQIRGSV